MVIGKGKALQGGNIHQRSQIGNGIAAQIQRCEILAGGEGRNIRQAPAAEIQRGNVRPERLTAEGNQLVFFFRGGTVDGTVRERIGKRFQSVIRDGNPFDAQRRERRHGIERRKITNGIVVKIERAQGGQRRKGRQIAHGIIAEVERVEPAESRDGSQIRYAVAGKRQVAQRIHFGDFRQDAVPKILIIQNKAGLGDDVRLPVD